MNCRRRRFMPRASAWIVAGDNSCRNNPLLQFVHFVNVFCLRFLHFIFHPIVYFLFDFAPVRFEQRLYNAGYKNLKVVGLDLFSNLSFTSLMSCLSKANVSISFSLVSPLLTRACDDFRVAILELGILRLLSMDFLFSELIHAFNKLDLYHYIVILTVPSD